MALAELHDTYHQVIADLILRRDLITRAIDALAILQAPLPPPDGLNLATPFVPASASSDLSRVTNTVSADGRPNPVGVTLPPGDTTVIRNAIPVLLLGPTPWTGGIKPWTAIQGTGLPGSPTAPNATVVPKRVGLKPATGPLPRRRGGGRTSKITPAQRETLKAGWQRGESPSAMMAGLGVGSTWVNHAAKAGGWGPRGSKKPATTKAAKAVAMRRCPECGGRTPANMATCADCGEITG